MRQLARNQIRLVHVEDDPEFAQLCQLHLHSAGFLQPIVHFSNGVEAIDYFLTTGPKRKPHAVLLDLHLPGMSGLEILRWLRFDYSECDLAVYLLTSSDDREHRREAANARVTRYLLKTPLVSNLIAELDYLILRENRAEIEGLGGLPANRPFRPEPIRNELPVMHSASKGVPHSS